MNQHPFLYVHLLSTLVGINAYHQPGVEAGKKAAGEFLALLAKVRSTVTGADRTAESIATATGLDIEDVWHSLTHLSSTGSVLRRAGAGPAEDTFRLA